ncbi:MAG: SUMF1/EgtB/PvdO family nonheme iron enzyme [Planctomycetes bacterium]|nr:SUMF1/EgtB/PvdO family nonheme iron enzyme [Planctomycetota bacterium]
MLSRLVLPVVAALVAVAVSSCTSTPHREPLLERGGGAREVATLKTPAGEFLALGANAKGYLEFKRLKDDAVMVLVPAGQFPMYEYTPDPADQMIWDMLDVPAFLIDKYEVTNKQVYEFLNASKNWTLRRGGIVGPDDEILLRGQEHGIWVADSGPEGSRPSPACRVQTGYEGYPAIGTSGVLAMAYAKWVGGDLPMYYEWQKAAAGPSGLTYPWGEQMPDSTLCNGFLWGPRHTMPVGSYPAGASPYGCLDMAGNVYERVYPVRSPGAVEPDLLPHSIKGASWLSPSWINFRNLDHCGQSPDACEGSVGFRTVIRDPKVIVALGVFDAWQPHLRVVDDVEAAFKEASERNVPIFLFLGHETCGSTDRVRAEIFTDARFIEYCNEKVVLLAGHDPGDGQSSPIPFGARGESLLIPGCQADKLQAVYDYFCFKIDMAIVPKQISEFRMSPAMFMLNPHRKLMEKSDQLVLVGEAEMPKGGVGMETLLKRCDEAQKMLGTGQSRADYLAGKPAPTVTWKAPQDE